MPEKTIAEFSVKYVQVMDEKGIADAKLMPRLSDKQIIEMYRLMVLAKAFDDKALKLQRQGKIGTYASHRGQEACQIGGVYALGKNDWLFPAFRENAAFIALGFPMHLLYAYWGGDERGAKIPKEFNALPTSIPVGTQLLHAVGTAWAMKLKKKKSATIVFFGDGATSEGDFHEAMNFAGVFKTPTVFLCQNNQYAISVPVSQQTAAETIAQKAIAYGFEGIQVDGNDVFSVYRAASEALKKASMGNGPTLIECFTYRLSDHTTADDAKRYRTEKEVLEWKKKDPIERLRKHLEGKKIWSSRKEKELIDWADAKVEKAVKEFEAMPAPVPDDMFQYLFAAMPRRLREQRDYLEKYVNELRREKNG